MSQPLPTVPASHPPRAADASTDDHTDHGNDIHSHKHSHDAGDHSHAHHHADGSQPHRHTADDQIHSDHPDHTPTHHDPHPSAVGEPLPPKTTSDDSTTPVKPATNPPQPADESDPAYVPQGEGHHHHKHAHGGKHHRHQHHHPGGDQPHQHDAKDQLHGDNPQHEPTHHRPHNA